VYQALWASYSQPTKLYIEYAVDDIRPHPSSSAERDFEIGYQQFWLFTLRNSPAMMPDTLKKGGSEGPSGSQHSRWNDPRLRQRLGALAVSVGFQTEEAEDLAVQDGEHRLAAQLVNCAEIGDSRRSNPTDRHHPPKCTAAVERVGCIRRVIPCDFRRRGMVTTRAPLW
jgi:hypothetical protein